jgi:hypothetical protein
VEGFFFPEKFWNRKAADGGSLKDWWNVRMEAESCTVHIGVHGWMDGVVAGSDA